MPETTSSAGDQDHCQVSSPLEVGIHANQGLASASSSMGRDWALSKPREPQEFGQASRAEAGRVSLQEAEVSHIIFTDYELHTCFLASCVQPSRVQDIA